MKYVALPLCNVTIGSLDRRDQDKQTELDVTLRLKPNRRRFEAVDISQTETQGVLRNLQEEGFSVAYGKVEEAL